MMSTALLPNATVVPSKPGVSSAGEAANRINGAGITASVARTTPARNQAE
jgi:hypothetical protein